MDHFLNKFYISSFIILMFSGFFISNLHGKIFQDIFLYGNVRTRGHVILRELSFLPGDTLTDQHINSDRNWLVRLNFLKRIEFLEKLEESQNARFLFLVVQEKPVIGFTPMIGTNDRYGISGGLGITLENGLGRREKYGISANIGKIKRFETMYEEPWIGGKAHFSSSVKFFYQDWPYLYPDYIQSFDLYQWGCRLQLGKYFGRHIQMGLDLGFEQIRSSRKNVLISGNYADRFIEIGYYLRFDTRDWPIYPKHGTYIDLLMFQQIESNDEKYNQMILEINRFSPAYRDNILALQCHLNLTSGTVPVYKRIHLGGPNTIRGYAMGGFWGDNTFYTSIEYRFPMLYIRHPSMGIHAGYGGVLFLDAGSSWQNETPLKDIPVYRSLGIGIHGIFSPYLIRLEYASHLKGWGYLSAGFGVKF